MKAKTVYQRLEQIVAEKQFQEIKFPDLEIIGDDESEDWDVNTIERGMIVDMQTANMLITVIATLGLKNQKKAKNLLQTWSGFEKMVKFGWSVVA